MLIHKTIQDTSKRQGNDKSVGNEFVQPQAAPEEKLGCLSYNPWSIDNDVTGVSDKSAGADLNAARSGLVRGGPSNLQPTKRQLEG